MLSGYTIDSSGTWGSEAQGKTFNGSGPKTFTLSNGNDYGSVGAYKCDLGDIISSYTVLDNPAEYSVNYLIQDSSGGNSIYEALLQSKQIIQIATTRKDCIACISPYRSGVVGLTNSDQQTNNIISFYDSLTSSSYAVFDSGYKYTFDRFNNTFRYIPLNGDIAGLMARTSIQLIPLVLTEAVQLEELSTMQLRLLTTHLKHRGIYFILRELTLLYSHLAAGLVLFGDKTAQKEASAFDRINVRRLFLTIEGTIESFCKITVI